MTSSVSAPVTRFAPSPTGFLHLGSARTALFNWLYARKHGGRFLLRIEDTDEERSTEEFRQSIFGALTWLGLTWDGQPVIQSQRRGRHQEIAHQLLREGKAYACYCTPEELQTMRERAAQEGLPPVYDRRWRDPTVAPPANTPFAIRLKAPLTGVLTLEDKVQGTVTVANEQLDDMVLLRSDGTPTFMLAVVVDDHDMGITHIIRGNDHLMNAFRQMNLYHALGWPVPIMAHIPLIHGEDGAKLSKRHGAVNVESYREEGILPAALFNTLLRLGWSHGDEEKISVSQALQWFDLEGLGKTAACFDGQKLLALNGYYLRACCPQDILSDPFLTKNLSLTQEGHAAALKILPALQQRAKTLKDLVDTLPIYINPDLPHTLEDPVRQKVLDARAVLTACAHHLAAHDESQWTATPLEENLRRWSQQQDISFGALAQPLRMALTGRAVSPSLFDVLEALGKTWTLHRLHTTFPT